MHLPKLTSLSLALAALTLAPLAQGAVLLLDFGPTDATGTNLTNSPYHTVSGSTTNTTWNKVGTDWAGASPVVWGDGTAATGVTLDIGANTSATTLVDMDLTPSGSLVGTAVNAGVYAGVVDNASVGKDGIFTGASSGSGRSVGMRLAGLAAGTYEVYVLARQTNIASSTQTAYVSASSLALNVNNEFDYNGYASQTVSFSSATAHTTAWEEGSNYMKFTVNLTEGQFLNVAVTGGAGDARGFLNAVQIVAVPEANAGALALAIGGMFLLVRRRR